ncbi:MAG: thiamine-phosphate kinase [Aeromicrobium sp.]|jgi:thiamine-monophosphate kinase|uniref:thiamine-phosphate kinase n=1 Tax=Aeromicrobium sp. TaxID=1871063 RepID=UPI0026388746|nr:thiamine-phosphate kinase [Aeromicrobium sp.]MCW2787756.1 thiamine-phosphate kinase [Aeromicrobium sp.]MCW2825666.1 thiamine-phosphate kinase [Aeromicrobium sp.]
MTTNAAGGPTIGDLGEFGLIDQVRAQIGHNRHVLLGPGDDAAHISSNDGTYLVTTDLLVEGRHFRRDWSGPEDIGRKAAACNLSDINAMGGVATALTVGFGAPADLPASWALEMIRGFEAECAHVGAHIVGGDVTASDKIIIAVTALGDAARPVLRSGAMPGDVVAYAGQLGLAAAGFATLSRGFRSPKLAVEAHRAPHPPYAAGPQAASAGATSMTDVSDGLVADLGHIADASSVAIDLDSTAFVIAPPVATVGEALGTDPLRFVLNGGDDYALVATFSSETVLPQGWTRIGTVADGSGVTVDGTTYETAGHQHFR